MSPIKVICIPENWWFHLVADVSVRNRLKGNVLLMTWVCSNKASFHLTGPTWYPVYPAWCSQHCCGGMFGLRLVQWKAGGQIPPWTLSPFWWMGRHFGSGSVGFHSVLSNTRGGPNYWDPPSVKFDIPDEQTIRSRRPILMKGNKV